MNNKTIMDSIDKIKSLNSSEAFNGMLFHENIAQISSIDKETTGKGVKEKIISSLLLLDSRDVVYFDILAEHERHIKELQRVAVIQLILIVGFTRWSWKKPLYSN